MDKHLGGRQAGAQAGWVWWLGVAVCAALAVVACVALVAGARPATAPTRNGTPLAPHNLWRAWGTDPVVVAELLGVGWLYARGVRVLWARAGGGRGIGRGQAAAFGAGLLTLVVALVSPLDALADVLFSAHMVQHLLLILVAAPLLILGAPTLPALWALPLRWRRRLGRGWHDAPWLRRAWQGLTRPLTVWWLHTLAVLLWHLPALYQAALANATIHALEHACFLGTALLFWWLLLDPHGRRRLGRGADVLYVFTMSLPTGLLGALFTFASAPWYPAYAGGAAAWGLSPLDDQQLAGLIMWIPAGVVYLVAAGALFVAWLQAEERRDDARDGGALVRPAVARATDSGRLTIGGSRE